MRLALALAFTRGTKPRAVATLFYRCPSIAKGMPNRWEKTSPDRKNCCNRFYSSGFTRPAIVFTRRHQQAEFVIPALLRCNFYQKPQKTNANRGKIKRAGPSSAPVFEPTASIWRMDETGATCCRWRGGVIMQGTESGDGSARFFLPLPLRKPFLTSIAHRLI